MRRFLVFLTIACVAFLIPAVTLADNQKVADYIAGRLGEKYPANSIHVKYNSGEVTLAGEMNSPQQVTEILQYVTSLTGVTKVNNKMEVAKIANKPLQVSTSAIAPERSNASESSASMVAPLPSSNPIKEQAISPVSGIVDASETGYLVPMSASGQTPTLATQYVSNQSEAPAPLMMNNTMPQAAYPHPGYQQIYPEQAVMYNQPMPMGVQHATTGRYDKPNLPNYAWPSYAANPNYAEVAYPRNYCPESAPYIGPFYPYPQVPLGWRKVTMEWHDGWWWLDFDDGTCKGPFSPLFRQPNPQRY